MTERQFTDLLIASGIFLTVTALALLIRGLLLRSMRGWARRTQTTLDDELIGAIRAPSVLWCVAAGLYVAVGTSPLTERQVGVIFKGVTAILILSFSLVAANLATNVLLVNVRRLDPAIPRTGLLYGVVKGVILTTGFLILLNHLGIAIAPILTALGVGGLAVALALQDTLANLFAGFHILIEHPARIGDYVKLSSGEEGYVADIGWRTTRLQMQANNVVVIPNKKLAESILTNYSLPEKPMSVSIPVSVPYDVDPARVERILIEEVRKGYGDISGLLSEPGPVVRLIPGFGPSSLDFTLICQAAAFKDQFTIQHELRKRILARFKAEGIEIPFPIRTVYLRQDARGRRAPGDGERAS